MDTRSQSPHVGRWFRDRITELRRVPASSLVPHPRNYRRHGPDQQSAMHGLLQHLGYVNALLVREMHDGTYQVLDGHMRAELSQGAEEVPVLLLDVTDEEADLVLATHDPVGDLALQDAELSDELARDVWSENEAVNTILRELLSHDRREEDGAVAQPSSPQFDLAPLPYEHYDYVVVLARNTFDFNRLCTLLGIQRLDYTVPKGAKKLGLGRCIDAEQLITLLEGLTHVQG